MKSKLAGFCLICTIAAAQPASIVGHWMGTLQAGATKLRVGLNVSSNRSGGLSATLDSPDQGAMGLPIDSISLKGDAVEFTSKTIGASYEGKLISPTKIEGTLSQGGANLPLIFEPAKAEAPPARPQEPKPPFPYNSEDVTVTNGSVQLAGTFTYPRAPGLYAAVLLVSGSGPQDRDETLFGHKPFLVLSDYLTRLGIAVLRLDDRGTGKSTGVFKEAGLKEFTSDALAAVEWLKARKEVNPAQIGIIGHSEGGAVAPLAAAQSKDVGFIVMMAGPGIAFGKLLEDQAAAIMRSSGAPESAIEQNRGVQERIFAILAKEPDDEKAKQQIHEFAQELKAESPQGSSAVDAEANRIVTPEIRSLFAYDPAATLRKVACPALAIDGSNDLQVNAFQNLPAIAAALAAGHNKNFAVELLPNLNHLFQTSKTGALAEYARTEETVSPRALKVIGEWIVEVTR